MAAFYALADLIEVDSTPLVAWGRLLGRPIGRIHRATYLDWRELFCAGRASAAGGCLYLGGAPGVAARGAAAVRRRWPAIELAARDGFFDMDDPAADAEVVRQIAAWRPDVLFVGMGMPRQERWLVRHRQSLPPCVCFPVGAAFDYEAGAVATPPRWTGRLGVEWLFPLRVRSRSACSPAISSSPGA